MPCKVISMVTRKGGTGKTTCARLFGAVANSRGYPVTFIDTDESCALVEWAKVGRDNGLWSDDVDVIETMDDQVVLDTVMRLNDEKTESVCIIDMQGSSSELMGMVFEVSDILIVPTRPSRSDIAEVEKILTFIEAYRHEGGQVPHPKVLLNVPERLTASQGRLFEECYDMFGSAVMEEFLLTRSSYNEMDSQGLLNVMAQKGMPGQRKNYASSLDLAAEIFDEATSGELEGKKS